MKQTLIDLFWKEMKQTRFFSSVTSLQKDTKRGMLPLGKWKSDIIGQIITKIEEKVYINSYIAIAIYIYLALATVPSF